MSEHEAFPYTVLLLKPQPIAAPYGKDIVLYHVAEDSADEAIVEAQRQAFEAHETENQDQDPADWHVLAVIEGHHDNMAPPPEPGYLVKIMPGDHSFLVSTLGQIAVAPAPPDPRWSPASPASCRGCTSPRKVRPSCSATANIACCPTCSGKP